MTWEVLSHRQHRPHPRGEPLSLLFSTLFVLGLVRPSSPRPWRAASAPVRTSPAWPSSLRRGARDPGPGVALPLSPRDAPAPARRGARDAPACPGGFALVPARARPSPLPAHPRHGGPGALGTAPAPAHARRSALAAMARGSWLGRREAPAPACPLAAMAPGMARAMPRRGPPYARCPRRGSSCPHSATVAPGTVRAVLARRGRGALARRGPAACSRHAARHARGSAPARLVRGASVRPCAR
jgi:hypothetical protein